PPDRRNSPRDRHDRGRVPGRLRPLHQQEPVQDRQPRQADSRSRRQSGAVVRAAVSTMSAGLTVVVDYGLCNIDSMARALEECGAKEVVRSRDPRMLARADRIVLPGVGSFAAAMRNIHEFGLFDVIQEASARNTPFLGACLGMQLMATSG